MLGAPQYIIRMAKQKAKIFAHHVERYKRNERELAWSNVGIKIP